VLCPGQPEEEYHQDHDCCIEQRRSKGQAVRPAEPQIHKDQERKEDCNLVNLQHISSNSSAKGANCLFAQPWRTHFHLSCDLDHCAAGDNANDLGWPKADAAERSTTRGPVILKQRLSKAVSALQLIRSGDQRAGAKREDHRSHWDFWVVQLASMSCC